MPKAGAVVKKAIVALLAVFFLINLYLLLIQAVYINDLPKVFGLARVVVISGSMQPAIEAGDLLVIREQAGYRVNDIITYRAGASLITHRVKAVEGTSLVTQGDGNNVADAPIEISQVEGKMLFRIPQMGRAALFFKTPPGIVLLVLAGALLILMPYIADKRKR